MSSCQAFAWLSGVAMALAPIQSAVSCSKFRILSVLCFSLLQKSPGFVRVVSPRTKRRLSFALDPEQESR